MFGKVSMDRVLFAGAYLLTVTAACNFPPNYVQPSINHTTQNAQSGVHNALYIYIEPFTNCSGCVTAINVCYNVFNSQPNPLSVMIINDENTIVHVHNYTGPPVSSENEDTYCENSHQLFANCCSYQTLTPSEQFTVQSNHHYGIWSEEELLILPSMLAPGYYTTPPIELGRILNNSGLSTVPMTYIHFIILPGVCCNCGSDSVTQTPTSTSSGPTRTQVASETTYNSGTLPAQTATYTYTTPPASTDGTSYVTHYITSSSAISAAVSDTNSTAAYPTTTVSTTSKYSLTTPARREHTTTILPSHSSETDPRTAAVLPSITLLVGVCSGLVALILVALLVSLGFILKLRLRKMAKKRRRVSVCLPQRVGVRKMADRPLPIPITDRTLSKPVTTNLNPAYTCSKLNDPVDEIYSYIPNEEILESPRMESALIPTTSNKAYMTTEREKKLPDEIEESDYVVNSLVYDDTELLNSIEKCTDTDTDYEVTQLVCDRADGDLKPDLTLDELTTNEAYVVANCAITNSRPVAQNNAATSLSSLSDMFMLYEAAARQSSTTDDHKTTDTC